MLGAVGTATRADAGPILLRVPEAADWLRLGRSTVYELINRGELPVVRVGTAVRIRVADLEAWAERQATTSHV